MQVNFISGLFILLSLFCMSCNEQNRNKVTKAISAKPADSALSPGPKRTGNEKSTPAISILGNWVSVEDSLWKLIFKKDYTCHQYYGGALTETDSFEISNSISKCGTDLPADANTNYLQLTDIKSGDRICYEINGITVAGMSLRVIDKGGALVFRKE